MVFANLGVSMPVFVLGLLLAFFFAIVLKDTPFALPPSGRLSSGRRRGPARDRLGTPGPGPGLPRGDPRLRVGAVHLHGASSPASGARLVDAFRHLILPAIALGTIPLAIIARITRSSLLDVLGLDYVRTARAKGLGERSVVLRHAARNALLPVVTIIGLQLGALLSGAVLTETVFNLAGVGRSLFEAITGRDYVVIQGFTLVIAVIYVVRQPVRRHLVRLPRSKGAATMNPSLINTGADPADEPTRSPASQAVADRRAAARPVARHGPQRPAPALRRRRPCDPGAARLRGGVRDQIAPFDPTESLLGVEPGGPGARRAVHPPARLPGRPAAAHLRHRRQRPRRLQPGRATGRGRRSSSA